MQAQLMISLFLLPLLGFLLGCFFAQREKLQKFVSLGVALLYLVVSVMTLTMVGEAPWEMTLGGWARGFGISFVLDSFAAVLLVTTAVIYCATCFFSTRGQTLEKSSLGFPLIHMTMFGVTGAFLTHDLFNLYVWFEVLLISSFVAMALGKSRVRLSGTIKYVVLNLISSLLFLLACGLVYNHAHTLNLTDLKLVLLGMQETNPGIVYLSAGLLFCAFALKSALFPFSNWLPASYHIVSPALSVFYSGLLTKVGVYSVVRVLFLTYPEQPILNHIVIVLAVASMLIGVLGALSQYHVRRILSFHIISQVGYIAFGFALVGLVEPSLKVATFSIAVFYLVHHMIVKTNLFLVSGLIRGFKGQEDLKSLGGLLHRKPILAVVFVLPALSLIGVPGTSGFWAKFELLRLTFQSEFYLIAGVMVVTSLLTFMSMAKIWLHAFWGEVSTQPEQPLRTSGLVACFVLAIPSLMIGLQPDLLMNFIEVAVQSMLT